MFQFTQFLLLVSVFLWGSETPLLKQVTNVTAFALGNSQFTGLWLLVTFRFVNVPLFNA